MARQCLRCSCLPGWHGGQRLWGLLLRHGWVLRTGSGTQAFRDTSPSPSTTHRGRAPGLCAERQRVGSHVAAPRV